MTNGDEKKDGDPENPNVSESDQNGASGFSGSSEQTTESPPNNDNVQVSESLPVTSITTVSGDVQFLSEAGRSMVAELVKNPLHVPNTSPNILNEFAPGGYSTKRDSDLHLPMDVASNRIEKVLQEVRDCMKETRIRSDADRKITLDTNFRLQGLQQRVGAYAQQTHLISDYLIHTTSRPPLRGLVSKSGVTFGENIYHEMSKSSSLPRELEITPARSIQGATKLLNFSTPTTSQNVIPPGMNEVTIYPRGTLPQEYVNMIATTADQAGGMSLSQVHNAPMMAIREQGQNPSTIVTTITALNPSSFTKEKVSESQENKINRDSEEFYYPYGPPADAQLPQPLTPTQYGLPRVPQNTAINERPINSGNDGDLSFEEYCHAVNNERQLPSDRLMQNFPTQGAPGGPSGPGGPGDPRDPSGNGNGYGSGGGGFPNFPTGNRDGHFPPNQPPNGQQINPSTPNLQRRFSQNQDQSEMNDVVSRSRQGTGFVPRMFDPSKMKKYIGRKDTRSPVRFLDEFERKVGNLYPDYMKGRVFLGTLDTDRFKLALTYPVDEGYELLKKRFLKTEWSEPCRQQILREAEESVYDPTIYDSMTNYLISIYSKMSDCRLTPAQIHSQILQKLPLQYAGQITEQHCANAALFGTRVRELDTLFSKYQPIMCEKPGQSQPKNPTMTNTNLYLVEDDQLIAVEKLEEESTESELSGNE